MGKVRAALAGRAPDAERKKAVAARLAGHPIHLQPARALKPKDELPGLLRQFLEGQEATVVDVPDGGSIPSVVADYLKRTNLPARLRVGGDARLASLPWGNEPTLEIMHGRAQGSDEVGLTWAAAAVAETGTLVLASGPDNPVTVTFLPETHIVVVGRSQIAGHYEDAWKAIRARFGERDMPRTVNFVSGPSRTADIGGKLVLGAHGPRRLCVIVVGDA
jgi:L-lactate dehydrogenase complex protein LldG